MNLCVRLELGTCGNECFAGSVVLILLEVLDETLCEVFCLGCPFFGICVGVAGIEDLWDLRRGSSVGISKSKMGSFFVGALRMAPSRIASMMPRIFDRDTFACAVPACVDEVSLGARCCHALNEFLGIFGGMEFEECLAKQAENVGVGSVMPRSVPASLAVKPERK